MYVIKIFQDEHSARSQPRSPWPHAVMVRNTGQVFIRYKQYTWLEMDDVGEALGYLILIITVFDLPQNRPQLISLLESIFFGYEHPKVLKTATVIRKTIIDLCDEQRK